MNIYTHSIPTFDSMLLPTIQALQMLGGSGTTAEIYDRVAQILNLPDEAIALVLSKIHDYSKNSLFTSPQMNGIAVNFRSYLQPIF